MLVMHHQRVWFSRALSLRNVTMMLTQLRPSHVTTYSCINGFAHLKASKIPVA
jgi:hypothetical protein